MSTQIPNIESLYDDYNSQKLSIYQAKASSNIFAPHSNIGETTPGWNHVPAPAYNIILSISYWRNQFDTYLIESQVFDAIFLQESEQLDNVGVLVHLSTFCSD